jgi:hypothetical protein
MRSLWLFALVPLAIAGASGAGCKNADRPPIAELATSPPSVTPPTGDAGEQNGVAGALFTTSSPPRAIALDGASVYVSFSRGTAPDGGTFEGSIAIAPRGGGVPQTLVSGGSPTELVRAGTTLVWIDEGTGIGTGSVNAVDLTAGATPRVLLANLDTPTALATDGTQVFVSSRGPSLSISIDVVPAAGGRATNITTTLVGEIAPAGIALDAKNVYFAGVSPFGGTLFRAPLSAGPAEVLWTPASGTPGDVLVADGRAFVTLEAAGDTSSIVAIPVGGGPPVPFASGLNHPARLAIVDTDLFWTNEDPTRGAVFRASITGASADVATLASGIDSPHAIAVADAVYVTGSAPDAKGAVYKLAR